MDSTQSRGQCTSSPQPTSKTIPTLLTKIPLGYKRKFKKVKKKKDNYRKEKEKNRKERHKQKRKTSTEKKENAVFSSV